MTSHFKFTKKDRLLHHEQFQNVFQNPQRVGHSYLTILFIKNNLLNPRLGLVTAKKQFKKAVTRNFLKRTLKELFRNRKKELPSIDIIMIPKKGLDVLSRNDLTKLMDTQWERLVKKTAAV